MSAAFRASILHPSAIDAKPKAIEALRPSRAVLSFLSAFVAEIGNLAYAS